MDELIAKIRLSASELALSDANEAATRLKLIDTILFDLLGWRKDDVDVEDRVAEDGTTEFIDYAIATGQHSILIEAKKVSAKFDGVPKGRKAFLRGTWLQSPVGNPIRQARDYARKKGVGFCIATNGLTWVAFPVNRRDRVAFEDSACVIFQDLNIVIADMDEFVALFSRSQVISGSLDRSLLGSERDQNEPRRLNYIYDRSLSRINRTSIFPHIEREIITAFSEELLSDNVDLLEKCYVQTPERTRFNSRIRMYITPRDQVLRTRPIRPLGPKSNKAVERLLRETKLSSRPIALLTLGLVGSGKTTFLRHTEKIACKDLFVTLRDRPSVSWVYVDFRNFSVSQNPREIITSGIFEYITAHPFLKDYQKCVKYAYAKEIEAIKSGPLSIMGGNDEFINRQVAEILMNDYKRKEPYALRIAAYAASRGPIFLVIDNVDQVEDVEIQSRIFLEGTAISRLVGANLVLAMRDATYVKNRSSAVFNAFDFDAVYIEPPNILAVLSKRFTVAEQLLKGRKIEFDTEGGQKLSCGTESLLLVCSVNRC